MKKSHFLSLIVIILPVVALAQALKKQTIKHDDKTKEVYYVLKDDPSVRHREYRRTSDDFEERGQYENNERVGVWSYYERKRLVQEVDFSAKEILRAERPFQEITWEFVDYDWSETSPEAGPLLKGGRMRAMEIIRKHLLYPANARRSGVHGDVTIHMIIQPDGKVTDQVVVEDPGSGLGEAALRVVQLMNDEWIPMMYNGKTAPSKVAVVVRFQLN